MDIETRRTNVLSGPSIAFTGTWREYLPIAVTNALLTICTLGIYRFWAKARERRYLWSRTHVIDDALEWSGTGKEMLVGFLIVVLVLAPFFLFFQFLLPALDARGMEAAENIALLLLYIALLYFGGVARFRALRYRLSRTWWHGIRGGSDNRGWSYGGEYLARYALVLSTLWAVWPWAATRLWNSRWNAMSFGPLEFRAHLTARGLMWRWVVVFAAVSSVIIGLVVTVVALVQSGEMPDPSWLGILGLGLFVAYIAIPLATLHWFAKYYRQAAKATKLGDLEFRFNATTFQWLGLFLGNFALAIVTLGLGLFFWGYRNWSFLVRHTQVYGAINVSELTQSTIHGPREAEGFADVFDVGAI